MDTAFAFVALLLGYVPLLGGAAVFMLAVWLICYKIFPTAGLYIDAFYNMLMGVTEEENDEYDRLYLDDDTRPIARIR